MPKPFRIEPTEGTPEPLPPLGGLWARDEDGGLRPSDRATALVAGLGWPEDEAEAPAEAGTAAAPEGAAEPKKRGR